MYTDQLFDNLKKIIQSNFTENIPPQVVTLNNATENTVHVKKANIAKKNKKSKRTNADKQSYVINNELAFQVNKYYAVAFTDRWYPGRCSELVDKDTAFFEFLHPSGKNYKWPAKVDNERVHVAGVLCEINIEPISNGRLWVVPEQQLVDKMFNE